ncbi:MAG: 4-hydroxy-tetrahydrodipicolinate reductase [Oscillospiraceae bacterium]|nr:4-hydroxy-tetrahydrodipicolinate reductase [Oscillospiraceae bacterium]
MIKVLINGVNGRMGQVVLNQAQTKDNFSVVCGVDQNDSITNSFPVYADYNNIKEDVDVIVDFSTPTASLNILKFAEANSIPVVIATTGFSDEDLNTIKEYSSRIPIFRASNMSYEVNVMADLVAKLAVLLKDSDIEIVDTHHAGKVDSPSGTALIFADSINAALDNEMHYEYNRESKREKRSKKEIGIHSIRGGTVVGKHTVAFYGQNETLEITHSVDSRSIFADGALKAAEFMINQKNGLYGMNNLI